MWGIDLLGFWRGELSARRLRLLIKHLPPSKSEFVAAAAPDAALIAQWGPTDYLLADLFDITAKASFKKPKPYPRPAEMADQRKRTQARHLALVEQAQRIEAREATQ